MISIAEEKKTGIPFTSGGECAILNIYSTDKEIFMIEYIHEPTDLQCGQAVLAMVTGRSVDEIVAMLGNDRETTLREMKDTFRKLGVGISDERIPVTEKSQLPEICLLSLETPRCWHWSLYAYGTFYDPEHGVMDDFPVSARRYYWVLTLK